MTTPVTRFSRVVFGFSGGRTDREVLRYVADFARLLRLDLLGLYVEDRALARIGEHPAIREFCTLERQWRLVTGQDLVRDLAISSALAQRALREEAQSAGVPPQLQVVLASPVEALASVSSAGDIVMLAEPRGGGRPGAPFADIVAGAMEMPGAVMILPNPFVRRRGPVVAIAETDRDVAAAQAAIIADAAGVTMQVMRLADLHSHTHRGLPPSEERESLIVMVDGTRDAPLAIALERHIPVLVLPP